MTGWRTITILTLGSLLGASPLWANEPLPIPSPEAQALARMGIERLYAKDFAALKDTKAKSELGAKLGFRAHEARDPGEKFVFIRMSIELSADAGDYHRALSTMNLLVDDYKLDPLPMTVNILQRAEPSVTNSVNRLRMCNRAETTLNDALDADRYPLALALADVLLAAARREKDSYLKEVTTKKQRVEAMAAAHAAIQPALQTLAATPADPAANLAVGRYLALVKRDRAKGIPLLAQGSDAGLKAAALEEQTSPGTAAARVALAERWAQLAEAEPDPLFKAGLLSLARKWYRAAMAAMSGLERIRIVPLVAKIPPDSPRLWGDRGRLEPALWIQSLRDKRERPQGMMLGYVREHGDPIELVGKLNGGVEIGSTVNGEEQLFNELTLDGGVVDLPDFDFGKQFTIAMWIGSSLPADRVLLTNMKRPAGAAPAPGPVVGKKPAEKKPADKKGGLGEDGFALLLTKDRELRFVASDNRRQSSEAASPKGSIAGDGYHLALVVDSAKKQIKLYQNAKEVATAPLKAPFRTDGPWRLGDYLDGSTPYSGRLTKLKVFPAALQPDEIKRLSIE